jgi:acetylornithine deacetylase/succinyl-diaminopimelate desuccinylase family protein
MNSSDLIDTLANLIRIPSVNPAYNPESSEFEIQKWIAGFFQSHGIQVYEQEVLPCRPVVIAKLPGRNRKRRLVFEAHCDTAGVHGMSIPPFEPQIRDGRLYGRGACDNKAGLAAMMHAIVDLQAANTPPPCELWVASTVDEEHSYKGVLKLCENLEAVAAVVSEPTDMRLAIASKGCVRWRLTVNGKAAHSSRPSLGANAIERMAHIVSALEMHRKSLSEISHPLVGSPTLNIGLIQGGTQVNVVPDTCWIEIDRRLIPGEQPSQVLASYRDLIASLAAGNPDLNWVMEPPTVIDDPLETAEDSPISKSAARALSEAGLDSSPLGVPFGSDASKFARIGIPSIILGPGRIDQAHTTNEYVEIEQVENAFVVYRELMASFE